MKIMKWLAGVIGIYVILVIIFEAGYLGIMQPSFEDQGIPMLTLKTVDESGNSSQRRLAWFTMEDSIYVSAHHWPRGWYHLASANPEVEITIDGVTSQRLAVVVEGNEFARVDEAYPIPLAVSFLMGFPPQRDILRLDLRS